MDNDRQSYIELTKLKDTQMLVYYGAMKVRIRAFDIRNGMVYLTLEEENGVTHDYQKLVSEIGNFVSRLRVTPVVEQGVKMIPHTRQYRKKSTANEYDIVSVWYIKGKAQFLVFSIDFSKSTFLKRTKKLVINEREGSSALYLTPSQSQGFNIVKKTKERLSVFVGKNADYIKDKKYTMELVVVNDVEALKLVPLI